MGADQSVTNTSNLTPNVGIEFTGNGGTFTNAAGGATIDASSKIFSGSGIYDTPTPSYAESFSNITINNSGTLEYSLTLARAASFPERR